jgi:hypothetical protein
MAEASITLRVQNAPSWVLSLAAERGMLISSSPHAPLAILSIPAQETSMAPAPAARLETGLRLKPDNARKHQASLWLVSAEGWNSFAGVMKDLGDDLLDSLEVAVVLSPSQEAHALVRRRPESRNRATPEFESVGFFERPGLPNLLVPSGYTLSPNIRNDQLEKILGLGEPGVVALLVPGEGGAFLLTHVRPAFQPASELFPRVVEIPATKLSPFVSKNPFDFDSFEVDEARQVVPPVAAWEEPLLAPPKRVSFEPDSVMEDRPLSVAERDLWESVHLIDRTAEKRLLETVWRAPADHPEKIAKAWYDLGRMYERCGRLDDARSAFIESLVVNPSREAAKSLLRILLPEGAGHITKAALDIFAHPLPQHVETRRRRCAQGAAIVALMSNIPEREAPNMCHLVKTNVA